MKSKYYTPSIEEFHVGFECESTYCLIKDVDAKEEWVKHTFDDHNISYLLDAYTADAYPTEFRVKFLDKEDIETLGFKYTLVKTKRRDAAGKLVEYESSVYKNEGSEGGWLLDHFKETGYIMIRKTLNNDFGPTTRFLGKVKNKSELKQILVQLCVE